MNIKKNSKWSILFVMALTFMFTTSAFAQQVIEMTGTDKMKFTVEEITAKPGEEITVKLYTDSKLPAVAMGHNFVLLKQGVDGTQFANASARHKDNDFLDPSKMDEVLAHTKMGNGGETVEVTYNAQDKVGEYEYICTCPGHYASGMKGVLTVK